MSLNSGHAMTLSNTLWDHSILPLISQYITIPNVSPHYDAQWREHGDMDRAVKLLSDWAMNQTGVIDGLHVQVIRLEGRTPVIFMEVPGTLPGTILLYGHLDKQPGLDGWKDGLSPWNPVIKDDRLYGRGSADDGYATFASLTALRILEDQHIPHARCVILIEACEESGSYDLPAYIDALADRIGTPDLVICLDSGCGNYDQLWMTTSLRGIVNGVLRVDILTEGFHSGHASGIVPDTFRIARSLLSRLEESWSGIVRLNELSIDLPNDRLAQADAAAQVLGDSIYSEFPWCDGARVHLNHGMVKQLLLNKTWRPALTVTGADGLPPIAQAGNVLRPFTALKLSMRIPPGIDPRTAAIAMKGALLKDPPYGARVSFTPDQMAHGWNAPSLAPWLKKSVDDASTTFFGKPFMAQGEGGTIPFMGMLGEKFPEAQFLITGLLGPGSNAHGPNEFLHIPTGKRLTACVASVIADHAEHKP